MSMKIYVQYRQLTTLLGLPETGTNLRLNVEQRNIIKQYRQQQLLASLNSDQKLEIIENHYGKPIAINPINLAFNHSHSQQNYALAYSFDVQHLGIDIENFSRNVRMQALAEHYFHEQEIEIWQQLNCSREFWFKVWTIKEAVLKAHGLGIRLDLKSLNTQAHPTQLFGQVEHEKIGTFYYQNVVLEHAMMTVAYEAMQDRPTLIWQ